MGQIVSRLDRVMADRKMSLKELSDRVGISNVNLSKLKTGRVCAIRFTTLAAICDALGCQPGDLLEFDPSLPAAEPDPCCETEQNRTDCADPVEQEGCS